MTHPSPADDDLPDFCLSCGLEYPRGKPQRCSHCGATPVELRKFLESHKDKDDDGSDEYVEEYF